MVPILETCARPLRLPAATVSVETLSHEVILGPKWSYRCTPWESRLPKCPSQSISVEQSVETSTSCGEAQ